MVKDIIPGSPDSQLLAVSVLDGALFFAAEDGVHGSELWRTDGTGSGTFMVKDINTGRRWAWPDRFVSFGSALLFGANDGQHGCELWGSDGTEAGTVKLKAINPGIAKRVPLSRMCAPVSLQITVTTRIADELLKPKGCRDADSPTLLIATGMTQSSASFPPRPVPRST